jgi:cytochrome c-type biogenesis protein CcmH
MKHGLVFLLLVAALAMPVHSHAAPNGGRSVAETFSDSTMEARARNLQRQLRCLVCQGETVDESNSPFAADVRHLVRQQIADGQSDRGIEDFLVARYGAFILMKPPLQSNTWLLWLAPFGVLVLAGAVAGVVIRKAASREG